MTFDQRRDLDHLIDALAAHPTWEGVLATHNSKRPIGGAGWTITRTVPTIVRHAQAGGNVGLLAGPRQGLAVFDVDDTSAFADLEDLLGPLAPCTVRTASGKQHTYASWVPDIPAVLMAPDGRRVGEPRRGGPTADSVGLQFAVCPPSRIGTGVYRWAEDVDLTAPLPEIPLRWRHYFQTFAPRPAPAGRSNDAGTFADRYAAARHQPGARVRAGGAEVKFRCPACATLGRDRAQDNARLFQNGSWGCAVYPKGIPESLLHWRAIGIALGALGHDGRRATADARS